MSAEVVAAGKVAVYDPTNLINSAAMFFLLAALTELNCALCDLKRIQDSLGKEHDVDLAFKNEVGEIIGIRSNKAGEAEFVLQNCNSEASKQTVQKIKQAYSRIKLLNDVKQKGYQVAKQEVLANGSVRIVVEKWR